jgi:spoIIIJ-associated protein
MKDREKTIENILKTLLDKVGVEYDSIEKKDSGEQEFYNITLSDADILLKGGHKDTPLQALTILTNRLFEYQTESRGAYITLDVNESRKEKIDALLAHTQVQVERVKELQYDIELPPSNAYERMLVHTYLADDTAIETSSIGEGAERRIVIKWVG